MRLKRVIARIGEIGKDVAYLSRISAPISIIRAYFVGAFNWRQRRCYHETQSKFRERVKKCRFSNDWFTLRLLFWLQAFEQGDYYSSPIRALEIGSWEGMSSLFILDALPRAQLTCVDTWSGADEHKSFGSSYFTSDMKVIEDNFDFNLRGYSDRLTKFRGTSSSFFNANSERFDLIYIDGSHFADDVIIDAVECFKRLEVGGLMIFDDYLFRYYKNERSNPAAAINWFLKQKIDCYQLVSVNWQVILKKTRHG